MNSSTPGWLTLCVWRALLGEIYPSIRAIAINFTDDKTLLIRYYLDRPATEFDQESLETVATNISASTGLDQINHIDVECQYTTAPIHALNRLAGFIYCRREYEV